MSNTPPLDPLGVGAPPVGAPTGKVVQPFPRQVGVVPGSIVAAEPANFQPQFGAPAGGHPQRRSVTGYSYAGQNLVNSSGQIARTQYDTTKETATELSSLAPTDRMALLTDLYQRGMYDGKLKPSATGLDPRDFTAMRELLSASNEYGYEWRTALGFIRQDYPIRSTGSVRRATPKQDLQKLIQAEAVQETGRRFTAEIVKGLVNQIQAREMAGDTTSTQTMTEAAVAGNDPAARQAHKFTQVADLFRSMMAGR